MNIVEPRYIVELPANLNSNQFSLKGFLSHFGTTTTTTSFICMTIGIIVLQKHTESIMKKEKKCFKLITICF